MKSTIIFILLGVITAFGLPTMLLLAIKYLG